MKLSVTIFFLFTHCFIGNNTWAQEANDFVQKGNEQYVKGAFPQAIELYKKALEKESGHQIARYNLAATHFRSGKFEASFNEYEELLKHNPETALKQKIYYNEGVTLSRQKKLAESIALYKKALQLDPTDKNARYNLQKALEELRKQQKKEEKPKNQQQQQQKKEPQKQPPASKKQIEQWLQSLRQKEQEVQRKIQQNKGRASKQPEKDW